MLQEATCPLSTRKSQRYITLSLLLHAVAASYLYLMSLYPVAPIEIKSNEIEVQYVLKDTPNDAKQIAESEKSTDEREPEKKAFLGERSQRVQKESKAAIVKSFKVAQGSASQSAGAESEQKPPLDISALGLKANLIPLGHLAPGSRGQVASSNDYLKGVSIGAQTLLNTKEYVYFSFYQRVRKQLEQYWEPSLRDKLFKMVARGRTIASETEHATRLYVVLDAVGKIRKIQVKGTSGVMDLDDAAVEAFNKAGPFPNPPQGLTDQEGIVRIEWEFILKT